MTPQERAAWVRGWRHAHVEAQIDVLWELADLIRGPAPKRRDLARRALFRVMDRLRAQQCDPPLADACPGEGGGP